MSRWQDVLNKITHIKCADGVDPTARDVAETFAEAFAAAGYKSRIEFRDGEYTLILHDGDDEIVLDLTRKGNVVDMKEARR
jgi:hypothetical protein